tara:strand:+ start:1736 stop:1987 length:252 start_codon:yes stop_codon:yes gene_type:complete
MKILYFSWIKDKLGKSQEMVQIDNNIKNVENLIEFLKNKNEDYMKVFNDTSSIKVSINMEIASMNDNINDEDEIAFFPPMTGG